MKQPQLLVVDDDLGIRNLLSRYLAEQGFQVLAVADGRAMKTWLANNSPDLIIIISKSAIIISLFIF